MAQAKRENAKPKKRPKFTDKAQSQQFIEAARKLGVEEVGPSFEEAIRATIRYHPTRSGGDRSRRQESCK
jgi:hypothetical protein